MGKIRKIFILANGSVSITQKKHSKKGYLGFFCLHNIASWLMFDPQNFINQLAEHCKEERILALDGPGSDIAEENGSIVKSISAVVDGHIGNNGISANLKKIIQFLEKQAEEAEQVDEALLICGVGWSRGGFILSQMKEWLEQRLMQRKIKIQAIHLHLIDPVVGGPTDRLRYSLKKPSSNPSIPTDITVHNYYSDSGNLHIWEQILRYAPKKWQINTPFFSGVIDRTRTKTYYINEEQYTHKLFLWLFPATHEALVGKSYNQIERWSGNLVLADIIRHLTKLNIKLNETWANVMMENGQIALEHMRKLNINCVTNRKYLDFELLSTTMRGRELVDGDDVKLFHSMPDFGRP